MKFRFVILVALSLGNAESLDFHGIEEIYACEKLTVPKNLTETWTEAVSLWYVPLWNKIEYYENALDFYGPEGFSKLTVEDLGKSCTTYTANGTSVLVYGFEGRTIRYEVFPDRVRKGIAYWSLPDSTGELVYRTTSYVTKTDNRSYQVVVTVWEDGYKGFYVSSPTPKLDEDSLKDIKKHVVDIGFNPKFFVDYDYETCPPAFAPAKSTHSIKIPVLKY